MHKACPLWLWIARSPYAIWWVLSAVVDFPVSCSVCSMATRVFQPHSHSSSKNGGSHTCAYAHTHTYTHTLRRSLTVNSFRHRRPEAGVSCSRSREQRVRRGTPCSTTVPENAGGSHCVPQWPECPKEGTPESSVTDLVISEITESKGNQQSLIDKVLSKSSQLFSLLLNSHGSLSAKRRRDHNRYWTNLRRPWAYYKPYSTPRSNYNYYSPNGAYSIARTANYNFS